MAKKQFVLIIDTETTITNKVADFAAIVCDRKGNVTTQCAVLVADIYNDRDTHPLFFDKSAPVDSIWNKSSLDRRYDTYKRMIEGGSRMLGSMAAINRWLDKVKENFDPYLTAYNLPFDIDKCEKTGIDLTRFDRRFCLWAAAGDIWAHTKKYREFTLQQCAWNNPTKLGNWSYKANAEIMARFLLGDPDLPDEPHTALEDIIDYELPIFKAIAKRRSLKSLTSLRKPDWRQMQVKNHFIAK